MKRPLIAARDIRRATLALLGLGVLLGITWAALRQGAADLAAFAPRRALERIASRQPLPAYEPWQRVRAQLERALSLDADNPAHHEALGRWHEAEALRTPDGAQARVQLLAGLERFRRALALRPGSAYTWANVALLKLRLAEFDEEFQRAVAHAARLGPWEPEVQLLLADIAFDAFERLRASERAIVLRTIANGIRRQDDAIFERAWRRGRTDLYCRLPGVQRSRHALSCV